MDHWLGRNLSDAERNILRYMLMEAIGFPGFPFSQLLILKCALPDWYCDGPRGRATVITLTFMVLSHDTLYHSLNVRWDVSMKHSSSVTFQ